VEQATKRNAEYLKAKQGDPATPPARHAHLLQLLDVLNTVTEAEGTGMGLPNTDDEPESTGDTAAAAAATASGETAGAVVLNRMKENGSIVKHFCDAAALDDEPVCKLALVLLARTLGHFEKHRAELAFDPEVYGPIYAISIDETRPTTVRAAAGGVLAVALENCAGDGEVESLCLSLTKWEEAHKAKSIKVGDKVMLSDKPQGEKAPTVLAPFESASDIGKVTKLSDDKTQVQVEVKGKQGLLPMGLLMLSAINKIKPVELFARMISVSGGVNGRVNARAKARAPTWRT